MKNKRLTKSDDKWFDGICGGIAEYYGFDPFILRMLLIVFSSYLLPIYIMLIFLMPED